MNETPYPLYMIDRPEQGQVNCKFKEKKNETENHRGRGIS